MLRFPESSVLPVRVLVVSDDEGDFILLEAALHDAPALQCDLTWCSSAAGAVGLMLSGQFDAVLVDERIDTESGLDLIGAALEAGADVPFILVSDGDDLEVDLAAMRLGVAAFVVKRDVRRGALERAIRYAQRHRGGGPGRPGKADVLTGLADRARFLEELQEIVRRTPAEHDVGAVVLLDLDGFSQINQSFGLRLGDRVLKECSRRLRDAVGGGACVARLGADEFAVVLERLPDREAAGQRARQLIRLLEEPMVAAGHFIRPSCAGGISLFPEDGSDASRLVQNAAMAMDAAKSGAAGRCAFFRRAMEEAIQQRAALSRDLHLAVKRDEFFMVYQPIVDLAQGRIEAVEGLIRWRQPLRGLVSPGEFIPLAEDSGLILHLGEWVLDAVCRQAKLWRDAGYDLRCSVNISPRQFKDGDVVSAVRRALSAADLPGDRLVVEITEGVLMEDTEASVLVLERLREMGVSIHIDDFGVGYSSLSYLRRFPLSAIKIDRSFVQDLESSEAGREIVRSVIALSQRLGLRTIAEGVETQAQLEILESQHCTAIQGYLIAKPQLPLELAPLLDDGEQGAPRLTRPAAPCAPSPCAPSPCAPSPCACARSG